tara:strand:- start:1208 stop:1933 length:726 start_codon:yes stop_codon:yes gene_type:complete
VKLQHFLSKNQIFSRRHAEKMIARGYVKLNGEVFTDFLYPISDFDTISFHTKLHDYIATLGAVLVHKPRGIWTNCKQGLQEKEVHDLLPKQYSQYSSIGRLDKDSEGLILFTNDGIFANSFLNSGEEHVRTYHVWTKSPLTRADIKQLKAGVLLNDGPTKPCDIHELKPLCYEFKLTEGKNRQIRRMVEFCETYVTRLKRLTFGPHVLGGIVVGQFKFFSLADAFYKRLDIHNLTIDNSSS